ncbi:hypothetical protein BDN70DRAFT_896969 [Pholiota conissans]|uniref:Uncharacterized protein n=1 Tax=Pholiota conissans TaxID=109636 RepID=A0A9P5YYK0_9AGAR|nr:hypothetical protein BDN70DRAFT_896969 [Pholiota conissans]
MSSNIVLPNLSSWVQSHFTAIVQSTTQADLQTAVANFLAKNATVVVNGAQISQSNFGALSGDTFEELSATVTFDNIVVSPATAGDLTTAGSVGVFYTAEIVQKLRVLGGNASSKVTGSLNVTVGPDPTIPKPPSSPIHGFFDPRRVLALNEVRIAVQNPVVPPTATTQ